MIYFGCCGGAGHYAHSPGMKRLWRDEGLPKLSRHLDGGYYPRNPELPNGVVMLTHENGHTLMGFSDNSVDSRPGSHSTFVEEGIFSFEEMVQKAMEAFPEVFARFKFEVTQCVK